MALFRDVLQRVSAAGRDTVARARDDGTWTTLNARITGVPATTPPPRVPGAWDRTGFSVEEGAVDGALAAAALRAVQVVQDDGWPAVFAWMLDAPWVALHAAVGAGTPPAVLGPNFHILPRAWVHGVTTDKPRGWPPHQDERTLARMPDGAPARLTVWLALTPARVDNGCVFLIPNHVAPDVTGRFAQGTTMAMEDVAHLFHHVRALPVEAGALLLWEPTVVHWGGQRTSVDAPERWALSAELLHQDATPSPQDVPLLGLGRLPTLAQRRAVVAQSLQVFAAPEREPEAAALQALASRLV